MSEGKVRSVEEKELVKVLDDYSYRKDDNTLISMKKDEVFLLLRCDNKDWWQVIRRTDRKPFYAPANLLKVMSGEEEKHYVKKEATQNKSGGKREEVGEKERGSLRNEFGKNLKKGDVGKKDDGNVEKIEGSFSKRSEINDEGNSGRREDVGKRNEDEGKRNEGSIGRREDGNKRPQGLGMATSDGRSDLRSDLSSQKGQAYMAKIEPTRVITERKEMYPGRQSGFSSFKGDVPKGPVRSGSAELPLSALSSNVSILSGMDSSSSHTSKSSLNEGSAESLKHHHFRKHVVKASSHDELTRGERSQSSLDVRRPKSSSNEELDGHLSNRDYLFKSNQLSYRHRSNSVDFKIFQKDFSLLPESSKGSLDKGRKPRISKDVGNRRRSWAVETSDYFRPSLRRGETVDAAIILDVPPKLPPKTKKNRMNSCENISKFEGPVDLMLQEVKSKQMQNLNTSLPHMRDEDRRHSRHGSDPLLLSESEQQGSWRDQWEKDPPVALPRKLLPPQVSSLEGRKANHDGRKMSEEKREDIHMGLRGDISLPPQGDGFQRESNGMHQVKKSSSHNSINTNPLLKDEGMLKRGMSMSHGSGNYKETDKEKGHSTFNPPKKQESSEKSHGIFSPKKSDGDSRKGGPQTSPKSQQTPETTRKSGFKTAFQSFKSKGGKKEERKKEEEREALPLRETPTPDSSRGGKMMPTPPSPQAPPQRLVMEDWGEYVDEITGRPYYYNPRTREKRWKPPRKIMHSVSIPEVPSSAKENSHNFHPGPPRSPDPDYPTSPKSSHKPFSYGLLPEGPLITPAYHLGAVRPDGNNHNNNNDPTYSNLPYSHPNAHPSLHPLHSLPIQTHPHSIPPPPIHTSHSHPSIPPHPSVPPPSIPHPGHPSVPPIPPHANSSTHSFTHQSTHQSIRTLPPISSNQHTLQSSTSSGKTISLPRHLGPQVLGIPPAVPPSSAKPTLPTTPTECPEFSFLDRCHNSALVDLLYNIQLPSGWEKRYDAYTQRIYFCNKAIEGRRESLYDAYRKMSLDDLNSVTLIESVVFQPRGVSWVSEVDIAQVKNKQYIRHSCQSTMDMAKELQIDVSPRESYQTPLEPPPQPLPPNSPSLQPPEPQPQPSPSNSPRGSFQPPLQPPPQPLPPNSPSLQPPLQPQPQPPPSSSPRGSFQPPPQPLPPSPSPFPPPPRETLPPFVGHSKTTTTTRDKSPNAEKNNRSLNTNTAPTVTRDKSPNADKNKSLERKQPPKKPPRKGSRTNLTVVNQPQGTSNLGDNSEMVQIIPIELRRNPSPEPGRVPVISPSQEIASIYEAGSRGSTFFPRTYELQPSRTSSFTNKSGHTRSQSGTKPDPKQRIESETVKRSQSDVAKPDHKKIHQSDGVKRSHSDATKIDTPQINTYKIDTAIKDGNTGNSISGALKDALKTGTGAVSSLAHNKPTKPLTLSLHSPPKSRSPTEDLSRLRSPPMSPLFHPKSRSPTEEIVNSLSKVLNFEQGGICTGRRIDKHDKKTPGNFQELQGDCPERNEECLDPGVKIHQNDLLKELNFRMNSSNRNSYSEIGAQTMKPYSEIAKSGSTTIMKPYSEVSKLGGGKTSGLKKLEVRKSALMTGDEIGSLLEEKPLADIEIPKIKAADQFARDFGGKMEPQTPLSPRFRKPEDGNFSPGNDGVFFWPHTPVEKWLATFNDEGKIYYYEEAGVRSQWVLPQVPTLSDDTDDPDSRCDSITYPTSPKDVRISQIADHLTELEECVAREGFAHRTFLMRDGKKVRKKWDNCYVRFIQKDFGTGSTGVLYFTKSRDEDKKAEMFEFYPPCLLEHASDKKTSRERVLGIRNSHETEVLLQFDEQEIEQEWLKLLNNHSGVTFTNTEKEEKKGKRGSEKLKRETSVEQLNDNKGITDKLRQFIKRRPMKETLEKKGIYKESVFGSTLAELRIQDKTNIPIFVLQCINHIEKSEANLTTDGLYRISGNAAQIQKIRYAVGESHYTILSKEKEVHNLSGALKLFFRELKEPLIPYENYQDFIQATGSEFRRRNQQAEKLQKAVNKLPGENYDTLKVLLQHLLRVCQYEKQNRMSLSNLAIVFGPCLLWPKDTNQHDLMTDVMLHNRVVEGMLSDFDRIFVTKR